MIKYFTGLTLFFLLFSSCNSIMKEGIKGNGKVKSEHRSISTFHEVEIGGVNNVEFRQGNHEGIVVEADENLLPLIQTKVSGGRLIISNKRNSNISKSKRMLVTVTLKSIDKLIVDGVGNVTSNGAINFHNLFIENSGVGKTRISGKVNQLTVNNSGVGNVDLKGLKAKNVNLNCSGVGNTKVFASKMITIENSGIGNVSYYGNPKKKNISNSGIGKVEG